MKFFKDKVPQLEIPDVVDIRSDPAARLFPMHLIESEPVEIMSLPEYIERLKKEQDYGSANSN